MTAASNLSPADETPRTTEAAAERVPDAALRGMVDSLPSPILIVNPDRRVFASNLAWRRQQPDATPAEGRLYAEVAAECTDAATAGRLATLVDQAFAGGTPEPVLVRCEHESGPRWRQVSARFAARGRFVTVAHEDVTALVHAEREQRAQQVVLERAQQIAHTGHWEFSMESEAFHASSQALEILGFSEDTSPSRESLIALVPEDEWEGVRAAIRAAQDGHPGEPIRHRITRPDGTVRWVDHSFDLRPGASSDSTAVMGVMQDVTEQVTREAALRESEIKQREALRLARASIWAWDRRTRAIWNSPALFEMLGYGPSADASDSPPVLRRHPDDDGRARRLIDNAIRRRTPYTVLYRLARADGTWGWVEERGTPVLDAGGELTGYRGTTQDVDEQVRREEALRTSDERQREALDLARAAVWTWDLATGRVEQSADFYRRFGYDSTPSTWEEHAARRHPDDMERAREVSRRAAETGSAYTLRYRLARADGGYVWIEARAVPLFDADGRVIGFRGTSLDVDEQVRREEALRESDDRQREALRIARADIWTWDRATGLVETSPYLLQSYGYETIPSPREALLAIRHPDDRERSDREANDAIRTRRPYTSRYRIARADGSWVWIEVRGAPRFDASGELTGYRGTRQDVDEQVRREETLSESDDRQREALRIARASLWTWDRRTRHLSQSHDLYHSLGYESAPEAFADRGALRHPDDRESSRRLAEEAIRLRLPYSMRYRLARADGGWVWIEERGAPLFDAGGEMTGYRGTTQDVDEQVKREEDLHEALKIARAGFWYHGREDTAPLRSPELYELIGLDPHTVASDDQLVRHPDDSARVIAVMREAMHAREPYTARYRAYHHGTHDWIWVEVRGVPVELADGSVVAYRGVLRDISEEMAREADLRRSEAALEQAQRLTRVGSFASDIETGEMRWSDEQSRLLGYAPGEVAPSAAAVYARVHEDDRATVREAFRALAQTGEPMALGYRVVLPDGTVRRMDGVAELRRDAAGRPTEMVGATQDVTERLEAESRVRHSEERLRAVVDSVGDGITLTSRSGRGDWANAAFYRMVGYTPKEMAEAGVPAVFDRSTLRDATQWLRSIETPDGPSLPRAYPMRLHRKDGTILTTEATPSVLRDGDQVIGLLSVVRDTTERDQLQAQVEAATLEVAQILQTAPIPIIVIEEDGTISMANPRTLDTFGWSPEELAGQDTSVLAAGLDPISHREYIRHYKETGSAAEPHGPMLGRTLEVVARRKDGSEFPVEVSVTEMHDPSGRRRYLGVVTDLTERKRAEEELTRMQKVEALGTLVAGVAHDFNNLLTAMVGGIELAKAQPDETRWLDLAQEAADRATRLVQQLLQFSRRSSPELQEIDPAALVERTTALVRETFDRRIDVRLELPTVWGVIAGDEGQLQQVVMNLLVNARDAVLERADQEGADYTPSVRVALREDDLHGRRAVCIEVQDNGPGMTAAVRARAFDPFFTTKPVGQGTGLGLATVAGITERHGGEVTIDSAVGAGTTVAIRLPLVETSGTRTTSGGETVASAPAAIRTAMVIDDEDIVRAVTTGYLEAAHYRVIPMSDGNTAIRLLEAGADVDVVLTDINMPSPNGWEVIARLRGQPNIPPIVVMSGYADEAMALERGAAAFLHKPFSQAVLIQTMERVLRRE